MWSLALWALVYFLRPRDAMLGHIDPHTPIYTRELDLCTSKFFGVQNVIRDKGLRKVNGNVMHHFTFGHRARGRRVGTWLPASFFPNLPAVVWSCDPKEVTLTEPCHCRAPADDLELELA